METFGVDDLVAGGFFGERSEAIIFEGVAGKARDVLDGEVHDGVLGHGRMAISHNPSLVEVRGAFGGNLEGNFVEGFGPPGGHREGDRDLFFG